MVTPPVHSARAAKLQPSRPDIVCIKKDTRLISHSVKPSSSVEEGASFFMNSGRVSSRSVSQRAATAHTKAMAREENRLPAVVPM